VKKHPFAANEFFFVSERLDIYMSINRK